MALPETLQASRGIKASQSSQNVAAVEGHAVEINKSVLINVNLTNQSKFSHFIIFLQVGPILRSTYLLIYQ